jgi:cell division protein FtsI/penicillin-binding protein 2
MSVRLFSVLGIFLIVFGGLIFNLYSLQVTRGSFFSARAESQSRSSGVLAPRRGSISFIDRRGTIIQAAINKEYKEIFAVPKEIKDPAGTAEALAGVTGLSREDIEPKLLKQGDEYELILEKAPSNIVSAIRSLHLEGVYIDSAVGRYYPFASLGAHVLGFVGPSSSDKEISGRYGIEAFYNDALSGRAGDVEGDTVREPIHGKNVELTIDRNIQERSEEMLNALVTKHRASGGTIIVQEPRTGKILALANNPTFDPNEYRDAKISTFLNPAVQSMYEPGSVFKVLTMAAGINAKKITPDTTYVDTGSLTLNGRTIKNVTAKPFGEVTMTEVIVHSINTGAAFAARTTGYDIFYDYIKKFGFDAKTEIDLPGEITGSLKTLKTGAHDINFATASFGQGVAVTPIQLINAISVIANQGVLMRPYVNAGEAPNVVRTVITKETARAVTKMMTTAVENAGVAAIPEYTVAGKTGTAQIPDFEKGGYAESFIHTYVGFAPASDPAFTILIKLDKPIGSPFAATTVVPAFKELTQFILGYYQIPPDNLSDSDVR